MAGKIETRWCAVYTRKSTEAGLEQDFNSLDAQREAALAFIQSQKQEGWKPLKKRYDDGGFSGGTMDRPALHELLADIEAGRVHTVVVYKVDRLTRSLADFAKIIELFDAHHVSFVAVTQQFNTTTSMGRLTLNVLLSFAQFEREVTGERIRDKFLQSRQKGMWMGGSPPLGYDVKNRRLVVNEEEARTVRLIYERFVSLGNVASLGRDLKQRGVRTKRWTSARGVRHGGTSFSRGHLYRVLQNRLYLGDAVHKGTSYPGEHEPIIPETLWHQAQEAFSEKAERRSIERLESGALLQGILHDDAGNRMTPSHTTRQGHRYRYYVSQAILQGTPEQAGSAHRVPAMEIEQAVLRGLAAHVGRAAESLRTDLREVVERVVVASREIEIVLLADDSSIRIPFYRRGNGPDADAAASPVAQPHLAFEKALARAWSWRRRIEKGEFSTLREIALEEEVTSRYVSRILRAAYLPPNTIARVLSDESGNTHPVLESLRKPRPLKWPC